MPKKISKISKNFKKNKTKIRLGGITKSLWKSQPKYQFREAMRYRASVYMLR